MNGQRFMKMLMKRILTFALLIGVCVATASQLMAIEKHKKDTPPPKSDTTVVKPQPESLSRSQSQETKVIDTLKTPKQRKLPPVFNDFIDVNQNGVDDRMEQGGYFIPPQKAPKAQSATKKTDSTKTVLPKPADKTQKKNK